MRREMPTMLQRLKRIGEWRRSATLFIVALSLWALCQWLFLYAPPNVVRKFVQRIELSLYDSRVQTLPRLKPDPRIVIVGMDDRTPEALAELNPPATDRPYYPLPRTCHAKLVERLRAAGAKVIAFDIMFAQELKDEDPRFAAAIGRHGAVVAAMIPRTERDNGVEQTSFDPPSSLLTKERSLLLSSIVVPRPVRWIDPFQVDDLNPGQRRPHFGFAAAATYYGEYPSPPTVRDSFRWGTKIDAPLSNGEDVLIRYIGPANTFATKPDYVDVYEGHFPKDYFRGKIVLVGRTSDLGVDDMQETPMGLMQGIEVHANIVQMALTGKYLRQAPTETASEAGAILVAIFLLVLLRWSLTPAIVVALIEGLVWALGITTYQLRSNGLWIDPVQPLIALGLVAVVSAVYETSRARGQFKRFVPSWVATQALSGDVSGENGTGASNERAVTVVFCDIRNFTTISERYPEEAVELLRRFFDAGDRAARRHGTELDKYVGDEIMLYFFDRAPRRFSPPIKPEDSHPMRAVRWALDMLEAAREIDAAKLAGSTGFRIGIGIATGVAREGLIGVQGRVQNTVVGDVVNTAARLQNATKDVKRPLLMNEAAYQAISPYMKTEALGEISVRGKTQTQAIYTVDSR